MTNLQLFLAVALPVIAIITSLIVSLVQISGIRDDMREIRTDIREIRTAMDDIRGRLTKVESRLDNIDQHFGQQVIKP